MEAVQALILAGGAGTRFWPMSRRLRPKQLLALGGERTLLQETVARLHPLVTSESVWVCTTRTLGREVCRQLERVPADQILFEPEGRNTAAAIGWAIHCMPEDKRQAPLVVLPSDHRVGDAAAFREGVARAAEAASEQERVVTLGIKPAWPETGYGYLEVGEELDAARGLRQVVRFTEKPDSETARRFVASGNYLWNAGIFVFRGELLLRLLARHEPELARRLEEIEAEPERLDELYRRLPSVSIDYCVMEKTDALATVPVDCGWNDLGSWAALAEDLPRDGEGNALQGDVVAVDSADNVLVAEVGTLAVLGVKDLVVVRAGDAVLVMAKGRSQEVRRLVERLRKAGREDLL